MRLITFPVARSVLMTAMNAIIIHIFKINWCKSHVMRIVLARTMIILSGLSNTTVQPA